MKLILSPKDNINNIELKEVETFCQEGCTLLVIYKDGRCRNYPMEHLWYWESKVPSGENRSKPPKKEGTYSLYRCKCGEEKEYAKTIWMKFISCDKCGRHGQWEKLEDDYKPQPFRYRCQCGETRLFPNKTDYECKCGKHGQWEPLTENPCSNISKLIRERKY